MAKYDLDLRMGIDSKLQSAELDTGALSYAVDTQNLYIDALKEDKSTVERQQINADKAYAIRDKNDNIVAKFGFGEKSFQQGYFDEEKLKVKLQRVEGYVDATYNCQFISEEPQSLNGPYYFEFLDSWDGKVAYYYTIFHSKTQITIQGFPVQVYNLDPDKEYTLIKNSYGAQGGRSFASGYNTYAIGQCSQAFGNQTISETDNGFVLGQFNLPYRNLLFTIGNGRDEEHRSNAFYVDTYGDAYFSSDVVLAGDYSRLTDKDRIGYFGFRNG